jgi:hypothetical protein
MNRSIAVAFLLAASFSSSTLPLTATGATLIGDPFTSIYTGWTDAYPPPTRGGNWRLSLHNPTLMDTNNANPPTSGPGNVANAGTYEPDVLFQNNFLAPRVYDLSATMRTNDDDIIGLVWNYQDPNNYFRVGIRTQAAGSFGGTQGVAVQKIVNGVLTQLSPVGNVAGAPTPITQAMINNRTPFDLKVAVNGTSWDVLFNNTSIISGTDPDLASDRKVGILSWAQLGDTDENPDPPFWGTEVESLRVTQGASTLYSQTFDQRPIPWRQLVMTNATGTVNTGNTASRGELGSFGRSINAPWIHQDANGFVNATVGNTDFIGPAVVVDQAGATGLADYEMKVRIGAADNDGLGVLVRAQDDNNFYRITLTSEVLPAGNIARSPQGLSVQKVLNGTWSELYRETTPAYIYPFSAANSFPTTPGFQWFDLSVKAVGNTLEIQIIDHLGNPVYTNPLIITDASNPLLTGTVGFHTWGTEDVFYTNYGGIAGAPLVVEIPEPASFGLLALAAVGFALRRRSRG